MKTRYIFSVGTLSRKDNSLYFRGEDNKYVYIPVEGTKEIYCMNEMSLNTKLLDFLSKHKIILHVFNYHENYSGTFYPKESLVSGKLVVEQAMYYKEKRLEIAKQIVYGIGENMQVVIGHYAKHGNADAREFVTQIKQTVKDIELLSNIKQVLAVEGELWQRFYGTFNSFLREEFVMNARVKRPPDNPLNAMISFGNMFLYTKTISQLYQTHLDQTISFLHEPSTQRFSLSLDLSEVFKPVIVYKTIFDCVNNRKIQVEKHFDKKYNYCLLNDEGRKKFTSELQKKMDETFMHKKLGRRTTYQHAIKLDAYKLIKTIIEDAPFVPFSLKEMQ